MLLCLRVLVPGRAWKDGWLRLSFWALNGGLLAMCVLSLLPVGLMQTWASVEHGYWYARSSEFMQTDLMQTLRWMRIPGDTVFFVGAVALVAVRRRPKNRAVPFDDRCEIAVGRWTVKLRRWLAEYVDDGNCQARIARRRDVADCCPLVISYAVGAVAVRRATFWGSEP